MRVALSKDFFLDEFLVSETAARMGRDLVLPDELLPNLRGLCEHILQPLRDDMRRSVFILSGWRPTWLNKLVGGSATSQHVKAKAADLRVAGHTPIQVCRRIIALGLPFDQLILEFDSWCHCSWSPTPRRSILTARKANGKTEYLSGIVENP